MWLRIDADMPWHDKIIGLPNDTARFAFVKVLCAAKVRGRSKFSPASLKEVLGSHARAVPALVTAGLLEEEDGNVIVHDFDSYQRRAGHAEAQQRYRSRVTGESPEDHADITGKSPTYSTYGTGHTTPKSPSGNGAPASSFMGFRSRGLHDGRHGKTCTVCSALVKEGETL